jgi:hypothetical protein
VSAPHEAEHPPPPVSEPEPRWTTRFRAALYDYFLGADPDFAIAMVPHCFLSMLLFTRHPTKTNFIFDEQEALLANPYVRAASDPTSNIRWIDAFYRDFWGLTADRTIGSYRPVPDLVWRVLWKLGVRDNPFLDHWVNVLIHGFNGALMTLLVMRLTRNRFTAWLAGSLFVTAAVLTEAVSGVVGIADVLGGTGALLALLALTYREVFMVPALFAATLFGLYSKESALCIVPLAPLAALFLSQHLHPEAPRRWLRATLALVATAAAFILYVEARRRMFPARISSDYSVEANATKGNFTRFFSMLLRWYAQPILPHDPLNNPLIEATPPFRIAGALRVYVRGLLQVIFPRALSGDYSAPEEPIPATLVFPESVLGGALMVLPLLAAPVLAIAAWFRARRDAKELREDASYGPPAHDLRPVVGFALVWVVVSYFPVSNIPIALPTVRAERFWYFPVIGTSILLALAMTRAFHSLARRNLAGLATGLVLIFFATQAFFARKHANDYTNDLVFWDSTRHAVPKSSKAHLNYSVMLGARGDLEGRLRANAVALELTPTWPMANVYYGDTLCRLHRADEAWPHYRNGFELGSGDTNLIALGLQCLWDEKAFEGASSRRDELEAVAHAHPGSWLDYLARDILEHGAEHNGVEPKYRPRGYNEGPKGE